jgi:hypothetical protein
MTQIRSVTRYECPKCLIIRAETAGAECYSCKTDARFKAARAILEAEMRAGEARMSRCPFCAKPGVLIDNRHDNNRAAPHLYQKQAFLPVCSNAKCFLSNTPANFIEWGEMPGKCYLTVDAAVAAWNSRGKIPLDTPCHGN